MYWIVKALVTPFVRIFVRVRVEGREHLPRRGAVILASNHRSFLDSIFIPLVVRRRVTFVAKAEYFDDPKVAWFFRSCGQIPIRREGGSASERALASATDVLRAGKVFGIYPVRATVCCTAATPGWRVSRCGARCRSCRSG